MVGKSHRISFLLLTLWVRGATLRLKKFSKFRVSIAARGGAGGTGAAEPERAEAVGAVRGAGHRRDIHDGGGSLRQAQHRGAEVGVAFRG